LVVSSQKQINLAVQSVKKQRGAKNVQWCASFHWHRVACAVHPLAGHGDVQKVLGWGATELCSGTPRAVEITRVPSEYNVAKLVGVYQLAWEYKCKYCEQVYRYVSPTRTAKKEFERSIPISDCQMCRGKGSLSLSMGGQECHAKCGLCSGRGFVEAQ
jgi:hypothetical protein